MTGQRDVRDDLVYSLRERIHELKRENRDLQEKLVASNRRIVALLDSLKPGVLHTDMNWFPRRYLTEEDRIEARRRTWRNSKRRATAAKKHAELDKKSS